MSDLQPVHLTIDTLVQVSIGRRNPHDGALDVILPSVNDTGMPGGGKKGRHNPVYTNAKALWERIFVHALTAPAGQPVQFAKPDTATVQILIPEVKRVGELPQPCESLRVEAVYYWPDRHRRDRNNFVALLDKYLGDALVSAGVLPDDDWSRYAMGNLERGYGKRRVELTFFPGERRLPFIEDAPEPTPQAVMF